MKELKIKAPEGYEVDKENSTFECIKFKPKKLTYDDVAKALFYNKSKFFITSLRTNYISEDYKNAVICVSEKQCKKLLALNKLIIVAKYLNGDWKPDFTRDKSNFTFELKEGKHLQIANYSLLDSGLPCFKSVKLAKQAIEILGEETIKLALSQV